MPLYETVMQEKPPVVFDIGTSYTKFGFAAEAYPRKIIPSVVMLTASGKSKNLFDYNDDLELYDQMVDFLQIIFFKHLLISPKERKIVIVENVFGQTVVRDTLARVLFRHFEVSSILFVPAHISALSTLAESKGVVIDIGYSETTVMPVYSGVQIMQAFKDQQYGGKMIHEELKRQLIESGIREDLLSENILEDIKVRTCFVTNLKRAQSYRSGHPPEAPPSVEYPISGIEIASIPGKVRETAFEILFDENNERDSLPHLILQSILRCPVDLRRSLTENIFVIGGSSIIMGLLPRLKEELNFLIENDKEYQEKIRGKSLFNNEELNSLIENDSEDKEKLHAKVQFKFHKSIGRQNFSSWLGGSLCGGTDLIQTRSLTRETFIKNDRVPDWICLTDNRLIGS